MDFFGIRLSDSTNGDRYLTGYNLTIASIQGAF